MKFYLVTVQLVPFGFQAFHAFLDVYQLDLQTIGLFPAYAIVLSHLVGVCAKTRYLAEFAFIVILQSSVLFAQVTQLLLWTRAGALLKKYSQCLFLLVIANQVWYLSFPYQWCVAAKTDACGQGCLLWVHLRSIEKSSSFDANNLWSLERNQVNAYRVCNCKIEIQSEIGYYHYAVHNSQKATDGSRLDRCEIIIFTRGC